MRKKKSKLSTERIVGYGSVSLLGLMVLGFIFPIVQSDASAEEPSVDSVMTANVNTNMTTLVRSSIAVALSSKVELDVTPKSTGAFSTSLANLKVTTNNTTGYAVYMQTVDDSSELKATNPHVEASIGPVSGTMSEESYVSNLNQWGYAVAPAASAGSMVYKAVPQSGDEAIVRTTGISREDDYDLSFAVAVGSDLPAGLYTNQLLVSVVANPIEVRSLNDITYMQDMTAEICAITFEGETKQLVDSRDGKSYWVAKLKDGNCWMTQNLALDLDTNEAGNAVAVTKNGNKVELNSGNTDISGVWHEYAPSKTEGEIPEETKNYASTRSWNLGEAVIVKYSGDAACSKITTKEDIAACEAYQSVNGWTMENSPTEAYIIDSDNNTYNARYLIGNYYQRSTLAAGTEVGLSSPSSANTNPDNFVDFKESICPKGWRVPTTGRYIYNGVSYPFEREASFASLLAAYGYPKGNADSGWTANSGYPYTQISGTGRSRLDQSPMYFIRGGNISLSSGSLSALGNDGTYWTSTSVIASTSGSYVMTLNRYDVYLANISDYSRGITVRCLAR